MPQSVNLTGTLIYNPDKCWNGYTLIPSCTASKANGALLVDMNGNVVQKWDNIYGAYHNILFPDGSIMGTSTSDAQPGHVHDLEDLIHVDFEGNQIWRYADAADIKLADGRVIRSARAHHDYQRAGSPTGYYSPGQEPDPKGNTLFISTKEVERPDITGVYPFADTWLIEIDHEGNILWEWLVTDHWDKLGFSEVARAVFMRNPMYFEPAGYAKETYFNNCAYVGPNKWFDAGDERFNPENIIVDMRSWNTAFIICKKTKEIVWQIGPDYSSHPELKKIGTIIGLHHAHIIPKGLPGEGNVLIFDNGGTAGFGDSNPSSFDGVYNANRFYSRVLEINPVTLELVWQYGEMDGPYSMATPVHIARKRFFSAFCSSAQRLPNGNTLVCECIGGRVFELTPEKEIVWEFVDPGQFTFRAFRYPYEWVPQRPKPQEVAVVPPPIASLKLANCTRDDSMVDFYEEPVTSNF